MKLVILNNKVHATHFDEQTIEGKYQDCTFLIVPEGKYKAEHTRINEDGTQDKIIGGIDCGDDAPTLDAEDTLNNVRYQRRLEYPIEGDFIDAYFKAQAGDQTELNAMRDKRNAVKLKHPKP